MSCSTPLVDFGIKSAQEFMKAFTTEKCEPDVPICFEANAAACLGKFSLSATYMLALKADGQLLPEMNTLLCGYVIIIIVIIIL